MSTLTWVWMCVGGALALAELVIPGGVVVFLGLGGLTVAGLTHFGVITTWVNAFLGWFVSSLVYLIALRRVAMRFMPGDVEVQLTEDDGYGEVVEVVEEIGQSSSGRVRFRGTTWTADSLRQTIAKGQRARIVARRGTGLIVERIEDAALLS